MSATGIIGPFENVRGRAETVNNQRYCVMIRNFFDGALQNFPGYDDVSWLQHDGATTRATQESINTVGQFASQLLHLKKW